MRERVLKSGEKGRRKVTAGHAGEKESEQIRRNERRNVSSEGGEPRRKTVEQDERGQATGSLT